MPVASRAIAVAGAANSRLEWAWGIALRREARQLKFHGVNDGADHECNRKAPFGV